MIDSHEREKKRGWGCRKNEWNRELHEQATASHLSPFRQHFHSEGHRGGKKTKKEKRRKNIRRRRRRRTEETSAAKVCVRGRSMATKQLGLRDGKRKRHTRKWMYLKKEEKKDCTLAHMHAAQPFYFDFRFISPRLFSFFFLSHVNSWPSKLTRSERHEASRERKNERKGR